MLNARSLIQEHALHDSIQMKLETVKKKKKKETYQTTTVAVSEVLG